MNQMKHNNQYITYQRMGKKIREMKKLGYNCEVVLETFTDGIMYFHHKDFTTIAVPIIYHPILWSAFVRSVVDYCKSRKEFMEHSSVVPISEMVVEIL